MPGQINMDSLFGKALYFIAKEPSFKIFVDVGSWNGEGTTKCLMHGILEREDKGKDTTVLSFETNAHMLQKAKLFWKDHPIVKIIHARIAESMMTEEEIRNHPLFQNILDHFNIWYKQDCIDFQQTPLAKLEHCDVAVLDGGEFCGQQDLEAVLKANAKVIALDDTHVMKNFENCKRLEALGFQKIFETHERNGAAIYRRA